MIAFTGELDRSVCIATHGLICLCIVGKWWLPSLESWTGVYALLLMASSVFVLSASDDCLHWRVGQECMHCYSWPHLALYCRQVMIVFTGELDRSVCIATHGLICLCIVGKWWLPSLESWTVVYVLLLMASSVFVLSASDDCLHWRVGQECMHCYSWPHLSLYCRQVMIAFTGELDRSVCIATHGRICLCIVGKWWLPSLESWTGVYALLLMASSVFVFSVSTFV